MSNPLLELQKLLYRRLTSRRYGDVVTFDGTYATVTLHGGSSMRLPCTVRVHTGDRVVIEGGTVIGKLSVARFLGTYEV